MIGGSAKDQLVMNNLSTMKQCIRNNEYDIEQRGKNLATLSMLGYTVADQEDILLSLELENFIKFEEDRNDPNSEWYWFFKVEYESRKFYIKYKIIEVSGRTYVKSLHLDESWQE